MNGNVGRSAESAISVARSAIGMSVRDLHGAKDGDQKYTEQRKEDSPGMVGAMSLSCVTHIRHYTTGPGAYLR